MEGKGPVRSWVGALFYRHTGGMPTRIPRGIPLKGKGEVGVPAGKRGPILMGTDNLLPASAKVEAQRPAGLRIEPREFQMPGLTDDDQMGPLFSHYPIVEDIQGTNPRDRGIVLGVDPKSPRFVDVGSLQMGPFGRTANLFDARETRASRWLAILVKILHFDVTAWLLGNKK